MSLYGPLSWFCKLISSFRRLWTAVETRSWRDFGKSLETVVCLLLLSNGGPLSLVCLKVATMKKSASFWCDLFPEWLENDRWRRFQSSLDRITSCLTSGSAESLGGKYLPGATLTSAPVSTLLLTFLPLTLMLACHGSRSSGELTGVVPLNFTLFSGWSVVMTPNMTSLFLFKSSESFLWAAFSWVVSLHETFPAFYAWSLTGQSFLPCIGLLPQRAHFLSVTFPERWNPRRLLTFLGFCFPCFAAIRLTSAPVLSDFDDTE